MSLPTPAAPSSARPPAPPTATAGPVDATAETPRVRTTLRRRLFWIVAGLLALLAALFTLFSGASGVSDASTYSIDNAGPRGSRAVAEVLREQGVDVVEASNLDEARAAVDSADGDASILFFDALGYLNDDGLGQLDAMTSLGADLVLVEPGSTELDALTDGVANAGAAAESTAVTAGCSLPAAERAGTISQPYAAYRLTAQADASSATTCFGSVDDAYSLIQQPSGQGTVTVLGAGSVLTNDEVVLQGNAALALGLLGTHETLVWYLPSYEDLEGAAPTLGDLTPGWVTPVILLLIAVTVAAGVWRGRRFGPVVVENLPVTVRASETMEGRARLYARQAAHARALDALRIGTVSRLTTMLNLPRYAPVAEVSRSVANTTGRPVDEVHDILVGALPASERELMLYSDRLLVLEQQVAAATSLR
ncbi:DUF4350 domain-containing protein [Herbiconiux liangxiaofengii]|uniref:DUF4350 domain-containing protein n=1 Tax=Herbiconiux liangxiaofengii TaxID=3342795 RepID=UPI0035B97D93